MEDKPKVRIIRPTEAESVRLLRDCVKNGEAVDLCLGPSGAWIEWTEGTPLPWTVLAIARYRGIGTEGVDGEGI